MRIVILLSPVIITISQITIWLKTIINLATTTQMGIYLIMLQVLLLLWRITIQLKLKNKVPLGSKQNNHLACTQRMNNNNGPKK